MSDDVSYAASIGASINKGLGSIKPPKTKKPKSKENKEKTIKKVKSTQIKKEDKYANIEDAVIVEPTSVKSERLNSPKETTTGQKSISFNPRTLPTHGPGSEYNPNRGRQFNG